MVKNFKNIPKYVIHLNHRADRLRNINFYIKPKINDIEIVEGIYNKANPHIGISESFKKIIKHAKDNNFKDVLIIEDDLKILGTIESLIQSIEQLPTDYNIMLGGVYLTGTAPQDKLKSHSSHLYKLEGDFSGLHFTLFNESSYDIVLNHNYDIPQIDRYLASLNLNVYCTKPFYAMQHDGYSDNAKRVTNYLRRVKIF